jgi:ATP-dependent DNA helicase RecG
MELGLTTSCRYLKGVGPARAEALERLDIRTVEDLLLHLPRRYFDRSQVAVLRELVPCEQACVRIRVESLHARRARGGRRTVVATVADDTGKLRVVWYNAWSRSALQPGNEVLLAGPVIEARGRLEMRQPEFERIESALPEAIHGGRIVPLYPLTQGVSQKWLRGLVARALDAVLPEVQELLPAAVRGDLPDRAAALQSVHFPKNLDETVRARERLALEELFLMQIVLLRRKRARAGGEGIRMDRRRGLHRRWLAGLPFQLTGAQERVLDEVYADLESGHWMQRLVQGDVGSGKTVIGVAALLFAVGNGWQGAFMAPTEALAIQHAERLVQPCAALHVRLGVLVGSLADREKEALRARMASGDVDLVVGTHALVQDTVEWARLGLAVVDEQQRFGVVQRGLLQRAEVPGTAADSSAPRLRPHVLILTATPIPRSLALTSFGDLDVSRLDEKPPGRMPVRTRIVPHARREAMLRFVRAELSAGRQAFVVLPLIEESEVLELRAATEEYERLRKGPLAGLRIGLLHGRLPAVEKEALWREFRGGTVQLLVCTSIVEVGLDVASATIMIVHHPERFGLAQLHQLRGRVGRGSDASWCFLLPGVEAGDEAFDRLRAFAVTDDGFQIAELDLRVRGMGDLVGTRQHGMHSLRIAALPADQPLLERARDRAVELLRVDPDLHRPENSAIRIHLEKHWRERGALAEIG